MRSAADVHVHLAAGSRGPRALLPLSRSASKEGHEERRVEGPGVLTAVVVVDLGFLIAVVVVDLSFLTAVVVVNLGFCLTAVLRVACD